MNGTVSEPDSQRDDDSLLRDVARLADSRCVQCGNPLCGHQAVISVVMGSRDSPHCVRCFALALEQPAEELRDRAWSHISRRECFARAWRTANERESFPADALPRCLWDSDSAAPNSPAEMSAPAGLEANFDLYWDAGDMSCGDLVMALRSKLLAAPKSSVLRVVARDPAASVDLPAWCGLTGHSLLRAAAPEFDIRRKGD
ncbi:MAG: hypothetical protein K2X38_18915 [Gemmataceae bacterium]|nr:hypothetical protein [Gemmataceae bacterium]